VPRKLNVIQNCIQTKSPADIITVNFCIKKKKKIILCATSRLHYKLRLKLTITYVRCRVNFPLMCPLPSHPTVGQLQKLIKTCSFHRLQLLSSRAQNTQCTEGFKTFVANSYAFCETHDTQLWSPCSEQLWPELALCLTAIGCCWRIVNDQ
jgi:hypothetical protein